MRSCLVLVCVASCGRIGFEAVPIDTLSDAPPLPMIELPFLQVDPTTLPPFGPAQVVPGLSLPGIEDDDPCLTRDQLEIFFDSERGGGNDIYTSRRATLTDPWSTPVPITQLNSVSTEEHPQISGDGLRLYFTSGRGGDANIYESTRLDRDSPWSTPVRLDSLNTAENDAMGSVNATGHVLVVSSTRGGMTTDDLYESQRIDPSSSWPTPIAIAALNTATYEVAPHLDDYGLAMYFERGGISQIVWSMRAQISAAWGPRMSVPELDDVVLEESDPWLSPDLRTIYFVRHDGAGTKDIYIATR